ncbi:hypothetical protein BKA80DRAFT_313249 [Phyllosticta citrichinensis]
MTHSLKERRKLFKALETYKSSPVVKTGDMAPPSMLAAHDRKITPTESDGRGSHLRAAIHQDHVSERSISPVVKTEDSMDVAEPQLRETRKRQGMPADSEYSDSILRNAIHQDRVSELRSNPAIPNHDKVRQWNTRAQSPLAQLTTPVDTPETVRYMSHAVSPAPKLDLTELDQASLSAPAH